MMKRWLWIPTVGRAGTARTLDWVDPEVSTIVARVSEVAEYEERYPNFPVKCLQGSHIGETRRNILHHVQEPHVQIDDDIVLKCVDPYTDLMLLLSRMRDRLADRSQSGYSMTGIGMQYMGSMHYKQARDHEDMPVYCIYGISPDVWDVPNHHFPVGDDKVLNMWAMAHRGTSVDFAGRWSNASFDRGTRGTRGGCFEYRTLEMIVDTYYRMETIWPRYVSVRELKKPVMAYGFMIDKRLVIAWGKIRRDAPEGSAQEYLSTRWRDWLQHREEKDEKIGALGAIGEGRGVDG